MKHLTKAQIEQLREPGKPEGEVNPWALAIPLSIILWLGIALAVKLVVH